MDIRHLSASRIEIYKTCPLRYRLRYHDHLDQAETSTSAEFGKWVHKCLDRFIKGEGELKDLLKQEAPNFHYEESQLKKLPIILQNFFSFQKEHPGGESEWVFTLPFEDTEIVGAIDRIIPGSPYEIFDYKMGQVQKKDLRKDLQTRIYAYALHKLRQIPIEEISVSLVYLSQGKIQPVRFKEEMVGKLEMELSLILKEIRATEPKEARAIPAWKCRWCEFCKICPHGARFR